MDRSVASVVSDTLVLARVDGKASGGGGRGEATVGVVGTKSTLEESAINALVLTAGDVRLVVAVLASATQLGLATVERGAVAVSEASLAREHAATSIRGGSVTLAVDGLVVDDQNIGEIDILGAIDEADTHGTNVALSLLATVGPLEIGVATEIGQAVERALRVGGAIDSDVLASGGSLQTRELGAISANAITTARVVAEDAVSLRGSGATTSVNLATVLGGTVAIEIVRSAGVRAQTSARHANVVGTTLDDSGVQRGLSESKARGRALGILEGSLAGTRGKSGTAVGSGVLATVAGVTVAVLEASLALQEAGTNNSTSGHVGLGRAISLGNDDVVGGRIEGLAIEAIVGNIGGVAASNRADTRSNLASSGGADSGGELATVGNKAVAIVVAGEAVGGRGADTAGASDGVHVDVGEGEARVTTRVAVLDIIGKVDAATNGVRESAAISERSSAVVDLANTTNARLDGSIEEGTLEVATVAMVRVGEGVNLATIGELSVAVGIAGAARQHAVAVDAISVGKMTILTRDFAVKGRAAATAVVPVTGNR